VSIQDHLSPADIMVAGLLAVAVYTDTRWHKVPNALTFGVMGVALLVRPGLALIQHDASAVFPAFLQALLGILAAFGPGFLFWRLGGAMKAGDAKLLMAMGAILGPFEVLRVFLVVLIVQIPVGIVQLWRAGRLRSLFRVVKAGVFQQPDGPAPMVVPFAWVIATAYVITLIFPAFCRFWS
jgi:Flp pilus assembly protein protease CpaA